MNEQKNIVTAILVIVLVGLGIWYFSSQPVTTVPLEMPSDTTASLSDDLNQIQDNSDDLNAEADQIGQQIDSL